MRGGGYRKEIGSGGNEIAAPMSFSHNRRRAAGTAAAGFLGRDQLWLKIIKLKRPSPRMIGWRNISALVLPGFHR